MENQVMWELYSVVISALCSGLPRQWEWLLAKTSAAYVSKQVQMISCILSLSTLQITDVSNPYSSKRESAPSITASLCLPKSWGHHCSRLYELFVTFLSLIEWGPLSHWGWRVLSEMPAPASQCSCLPVLHHLGCRNRRIRKSRSLLIT